MDAAHAHSSTVSDTITITATASGPCTEFRVFYGLRSGGGTFTWAVDGGSASSVNTDAVSDSGGVLSITGLTAGTHTLVLTVTNAGTAGVILCGVACINTAVAGVRLDKLGNSGAQASHFTGVPSPIWMQQLSGLAPDLTIIEFATNEMSANVTPAVYAANIQTIIERARGAAPDTCVLLVSPADNGLTGKAHTMAEYRDALRDLAVAQGCAWLDLYEIVGPYSAANARSLYGDTAHINAAGGQLLARELYERLLRL